jgi:hypothetical protein
VIRSSTSDSEQFQRSFARAAARLPTRSFMTHSAVRFRGRSKRLVRSGCLSRIPAHRCDTVGLLRRGAPALVLRPFKMGRRSKPSTSPTRNISHQQTKANSSTKVRHGRRYCSPRTCCSFRPASGSPHSFRRLLTTVPECAKPAVSISLFHIDAEPYLTRSTVAGCAHYYSVIYPLTIAIRR